MPTGRLACSLVFGCLLPILIAANHPDANAASSNVYVEPSVMILSTTVEIPPGELRSVSAQLTKDLTVMAATNVSGGFDDQVESWLMEEEEYQKFEQQKHSYHIGKTTLKRDAIYKYLVPKTGHYRIVFDNREATVFSRKVELYIYGILPAPTDDHLKLTQILQQGYYDFATSVFIVPEFRIFVHRCGMVNAFSSPDIHICTELLESPALNTFGFTYYHELAHTLLTLWEYPLSDNEDVADEFAAVALIVLDKKEIGLSAAKFFQDETSFEGFIRQILADDRHTLSPQRARNIVRWLNEGSPLVKRWQKIFVPNMQTSMLLALHKGTADWIDHELVRGELVKRAALAK